MHAIKIRSAWYAGGQIHVLTREGHYYYHTAVDAAALSYKRRVGLVAAINKARVINPAHWRFERVMSYQEIDADFAGRCEADESF